MKQPVKEKENSELKPKFSLKFDLVSYPACVEGLLNIYHHIMLLAWICQILSPFISIIHRFRLFLQIISCVRIQRLQFLVGCPNLARPCKGGSLENVTYKFFLISPAVSRISCSEMEGWWPYSWCFVGCCIQDLLNLNIYIYIYIYIYSILSPVKPELGVIPSGQEIIHE